MILAGGASSRMPAGKPGAELWGSTLLALAVATVRVAQLTPIVCARATTPLPAVDAELWREPGDVDARPHPLAAMAWCLERAGAPLLFLPVDLPLLPPEALAAVAAAGGGPVPAMLALEGRPAALVAAASPAHAEALAAAAQAGAPVLRTLAGLGAALVQPPSIMGPRALTNVNDPSDLAALQGAAIPAWHAR